MSFASAITSSGHNSRRRLVSALEAMSLEEKMEMKKEIDDKVLGTMLGFCDFCDLPETVDETGEERKSSIISRLVATMKSGKGLDGGSRCVAAAPASH